MRYILAFIMLLALVGTASAKKAEAPVEYDKRSFTCPVGGKSFTQKVGYSSFPLITLTDGSWLGDQEIGVQVPVCPDNGALLLPDFEEMTEDDPNNVDYVSYSAADLAKLPGLIANPEYLARKADGAYAQAYWLATQLGRPALGRFHYLQRATWAARDVALRKKLVTVFATDGPALIDAMAASEIQRVHYRTFIVNALRELGRFDEATALLDKMTASVLTPMQGDDPDNIYGPEEFAPEMRLAISEKDDGRFPAEMLDRRMVGDICDEKLIILYGPTKPSTKAACKIRRVREAKESNDTEAAFKLREDKPALDGKCAATPEEKRDGALKKACDFALDDRDRIEGNRLAKDGPTLAAACEATPKEQSKGALWSGCIRYEIALDSALGVQMADDPVAYALFCTPSDVDSVSDDADHISACVSAESALKQRDEERLLADPKKLEVYCAKTDDFVDDKHESGISYEVILSACSSLERDKESAEIERLATDEAEFDKTCGRYAKTNNADNEVNIPYGSQQERCNRAWRLRENTRARLAGEAKGLSCFSDVIYSPERPKCVPKAEYDREMAVRRDPKVDDPYDMSALEDGCSLMKEAHIRAAALIAKAKANGVVAKK